MPTSAKLVESSFQNLPIANSLPEKIPFVDDTPLIYQGDVGVKRLLSMFCRRLLMASVR